MRKLVRGPDIAELKAFCLTADLGSFSRAARVLRLSQPAVSKQIANLETLAQTKLFTRTTEGVQLTSAGRELYPDVHKLLAQAEIIEGRLAGLSDESPVRLAVSHTVAEFSLPVLLAKFEAKYRKHLAVELTVSNSDAARAILRSGAADIGIIALSPSKVSDTLQERHFFTDEIVLAVPRGHPWTYLEKVPLEAFCKVALIVRDPGANSRQTVEAAIKKQGITLAQPLVELGSTAAIVATALDLGAPALISERAAKRYAKELELRHVEGLRFLRYFVLVTAHDEKALSLRQRGRCYASYLLKQRAKTKARFRTHRRHPTTLLLWGAIYLKV